MKKTLLTLLLALFVAAPAASLVPSAAHAATLNTAIRGTSTDTVYWYANDGKRYVFPNPTTFYSWYPNFSNVQTISDSELYSIQIGGNVTMRPGAKLVKVTTDPKVYAVARGGILRHVTSEYLASQLYGYDWNTKVVDVPDSYFTNYGVGTPIYNTYDYNVSNEYNGVTTPSDSLRGMTGTTQYSIELTVNRTSIMSGDPVIVSAALIGSLNRFEIREVGTNNIVKTCVNNTSCEVTVYPYQSNVAYTQYMVTVTNGSGVLVGTKYSQLVYFQNYVSQNLLRTTTNRSTIAPGETAQVTATYSGTMPNNARIGISWNQGPTGGNIGGYSGQEWCSVGVNPCTKTIVPVSSALYQNTINVFSGMAVDGGAAVNGQTLTIQISAGSTYNDGTNYINGLVLNADRTNINPGNIVRLTANAFNAGTWSYTGNRITITDMRTGTVVKTCYDVSTCLVDVYPQAYTSSNLTAQYQAKIYDRNGYLAMSQYSPVIYLSSYSGTTGYDSYGYTQTTGRGLMTISPVDNLRTNQMVYITGTFTDSNIPLEDSVVRLYTERSATAIATCTASRTCTVSYPTGVDPINTRVYARLSSRSLTYTTLESDRVNLVTTR